MNPKLLALILAILPVWAPLHAQETEPADSLIRELQEIIVTAKQPATRLVGSYLVSTVAGSDLQNAGKAFDVLQQLPMLSVEGNAVSIQAKVRLSCI